MCYFAIFRPTYHIFAELSILAVITVIFISRLMPLLSGILRKVSKTKLK
jgi:hypothetical protein